MAFAVWDGFDIAFVLIASLYSWDSAFTGSIIPLWVELETLTFCAGEAISRPIWETTVSASSASLPAGAVSDWLAAFLIKALGFDFFFDASKEHSDNIAWCSHLCFCF
jgi:hypothetical protein